MSKAPTTEIGHVGQQHFGFLPSWDVFAGDTDEKVDKLQWPRSIDTYTRMRTDSQIRGLTLALSLPIRRFGWCIDPGEASDKVAAEVADDLGLPLKGQQDTRPGGRRRDRFNHDQHLAKALIALWLGFYPFEQVGRIDDDGRWRLRKLAPRHPKTFVGGRINVARDGGLVSLKQAGMNAKPIPISRLVVYTWDNEDGGNWTGQSMLRGCYRPSVAKDRTLRIGTLNIDRNGMGMPTVTAPEGASGDDIRALNEVASQVKAGERSSAAWPHGSKFSLEGVRGTLPDAAGWVRLLNEEMARSVLQMFMQLGTTETGSRALGVELIEFFDHALDSVADWYAEITTAHVIEDWVDWNYGPDEPAPTLVYQRSTDPGVADLAQAVDSGLIQVDEEIESALRQRMKLPEKTEPSNEPAEPAPDDPVAATTRRVPVTARQPSDVEVAAKTDFDEMGAKLETSVASLVSKLKEAQGAQVEELLEQIRALAPDPELLAGITATPVARQVIEDAMSDMAEAGVNQVITEAAEQGVSAPQRPDMDEVQAKLKPRAAAKASLLARSLGDVASRQAVARAVEVLDPETIADEVGRYLAELSDTYLEQQANASLVGGQNTGRKAAMVANDARQIYASELLDENTCDSCREVDGKQYGSIEEAEEDYPIAGFKNCEGGDRCRGTLIATYDESEASV